MSAIRTTVNEYNRKLEGLTEDRMYDEALQLDLARECILEVDCILGLWRNWRR